MREDRPALILHGHFYQPPRENPWTEKVERQAGAHPHHDWNERVYAECYRPNAYARICDGNGRLERIVNNYSLLSFNFGPTLLSWLQQRHPRTYARILEADRDSFRRRDGHGNAIAQGYNHAILPLCNARDLRTQIRWGLADFSRRFGREAESMWLPETACNSATVDALIEEGLKYVILSPHQAERVRPLGTQTWTDVGRGEIDPRMPYACFHSDAKGRTLAVFFYDGPMARSIAFEGALSSSRGLVDRFGLADAKAGQMVSIATDGETYGHHFRYGDRCLAHTLAVEAAERGFWVTNYGEFLSHHAPTHEVEIKEGPGGEGTAWSCAHGLGRWIRDCGCHVGGREGWNQAWRAPLRKALDFLRDEAARHFEATRGKYFEDPWEARDAYIGLILDRNRSREDWLHRYAPRNLSRGEQERALTFLEIQRHAMLMYTSCGWFFADVSGLETVQLLMYAGKVVDAMEELGLPSPREPFLEMLSHAKSNLPEMGHGADVYRRFVTPARVTPERVAAHLLIAGLVGAEETAGESAGYSVSRREFRREQHGRFTLATSRILLESIATGKGADFAALAVHLGEIDFYCLVTPYPGDEKFRRSADRIWKDFHTSSLPALLRLAQEEFGLKEYGLEHVLPDVRQRIVGATFGSLTSRLSEQYALLYEDNQRTIEMLHSSGFELPPELRAIAEFALGKQFEEEVRRQAPNPDPAAYRKAEAIAQEVARRGYRIDRTFSNKLFDGLIADAVREAVGEPVPKRIRNALTLLELARTLGIQPSLERAQEHLYRALRDFPSARESLKELALSLGLAMSLVEGRDATQRKPGESSFYRSVTV